MNPAFADRGPIEAIVISKPQIFISSPIFCSDDISRIDLSDSEHLSSGQSRISFIRIERDPAVRGKINFCPPVKDIIETGIVSPAADRAHIPNGNAKGSAKSNH